MMASEERSDLLQQYLMAVASCLEASTENGDPRSIEQFRDQAERAFQSLEEPE